MLHTYVTGLGCCAEDILAFSTTGIVDTPADSLFAYETGKSWASYHDPYFTPTYHPMYHHNKSSLERRALEVCEGDRECLFDAAATGSVDIALATLRTNLEIREMMQLMVPSGLTHTFSKYTALISFRIIVCVKHRPCH